MLGVSGAAPGGAGAEATDGGPAVGLEASPAIEISAGFTDAFWDCSNDDGGGPPWLAGTLIEKVFYR